MKQKTISLSREATLWEAGDVARDIAVVEAGRLGVRTEAGVVGIVLPKMVVGETALFALEGKPLPRAATLFALDDDTRVVASPAESYRAAFEGGDTAIVEPIVRTLVGQTCRNLLMVVSARSGDPYVERAAARPRARHRPGRGPAAAGAHLGRLHGHVLVPVRHARHVGPHPRPPGSGPVAAARADRGGLAGAGPPGRQRRRAADDRGLPRRGARAHPVVGARPTS